MKKNIGIGLAGLGTIGSGVAKALLQKQDFLAKRARNQLILNKIVEIDEGKHNAVFTKGAAFTTRFEELIDDPNIDIIIELIGGEHPALEYLKQALSHGKHVVTANKEVISKHLSELIPLAHAHNVSLRYEASVGGGIPLITPFQDDLSANEVNAIYAILNGTTNYILTQMAKEDMDFSLALKQAQELGYAEADPSKDIDGIDTTFKLAILATIAFGTEITPDQVYHEGISRLQARDFRYARELGYAIKLLAIAKRINNLVEVRVHPVFIPDDFLLAKVDGVYNAIDVEGDLVGKLIFYGQGAGPSATSSAVLADVVSIAQDINRGSIKPTRLPPAKEQIIRPMSEIETRYYMRMSVADQAGVLGKISKILGDNEISISSVIQKESDASMQLAEIVIMTHRAKERDIQQALKKTKQLNVVKEISNFVRVEA